MLPPGEGWWKDPQIREKLQLSDEQRQKIEKIARDHQIQEIDLRADVEKQDAVLRTLMDSDSIDKAQVLAQVDKLSEARTRLEKSHVEMLLAIRKLLTAEQAKKLRDLVPPPQGGPQGRGFGPPEGAPGPPPGGPPE
jgi:Spy/CpxP family protein refolding chaperone